VKGEGGLIEKLEDLKQAEKKEGKEESGEKWGMILHIFLIFTPNFRER